MKKETTKNLIYFLLTIVAITALVCGLTRLYTSKNGAIHRQRFYEQKEDVDVLFIGTSHAYAGYQPMELYRKYGISSFNLSTAGERFAVNYYSMLDAFNYHVPKVVVIDCHAFEYGDEKNDHEVPTRCHGVFDGMPMSRLKIQAVQDVLSDLPDTWPEYYFPLYYYHNRWVELERQDFEDPVLNNYGKGGRLFHGVANAKPFEVIPQEEYEWAGDLSCEYAEKIVQLCKEKGIDIHFMCIPFPCNQETQRVLNQAQKLADEYDNCYYVNLMLHTDEMDFNFATDMADLGSHVNLLGGHKVTDYIGEYLSERYEFTDYRSDDPDSVWNKEYRYYTTYLDRLRNDCEDYKDYLANVYSPDYSFAIYVSDMAAANDDGLLYKLIKKDDTDSNADADALTGTYFYSNMNGEVKEIINPSSVEDTPFWTGYADDYDQNSLLSIAVFNNRTGELVEVTNWSAGGRL